MGNTAGRYIRMGTLVRIDLSIPDDRALSLDIDPQEKYGKELSPIPHGDAYRAFGSCVNFLRQINLYLNF